MLGSVAAVGGGGSCAGSGARGPGSEGPGSTAEVAVEVGVTATGGGCEEGPAIVPVDSGSLF